MPRNPINYNNTVFYKIVCKNPAIKDCYVGMTTNLAKRKAQERRNMRDASGNVYEFIRANGGANNFDFVVLEEGSFESKNAAHARERYWLEHEGANLNCVACAPRETVFEEHLEADTDGETSE